MVNIYKAEQKDIGELKKIWKTVFDDNDNFISIFFERIFPHSTAYLALSDNQPAGSAYVLDVCSITDGAGFEQDCPYIYAVGVLPEYREKGIGRALTLKCREYCDKESGISCIVPAENGLFKYYMQNASYCTAFSVYENNVKASCSLPIHISSLRAEEYGEWRERALSNIPHLIFDESAVEFLYDYCRLSSGGFYALSIDNDRALAACEICDNTLVIKELLTESESNRHENFASSLAAFLGLENCRYRMPATRKHPENTRSFGMLSKNDCGLDYYFGPAFD